jgi:hypothetical protein
MVTMKSSLQRRALSVSALAVVLVGLVLAPVGAGASTPWTVVASANVGPSHNYLSGVSCTSTSACVAVGNFTTTTKVDRTLIENWNGTSWSAVAGPDVGPYDNDLFSVSCVPATTFCAAVGGFWLANGDPRPLALVRHGTTWTRVVSPNIGVWSGFDAVSCVSATRCTAVGLYLTPGGVGRTLAEVWNGATWTRVATPNAGAYDNELRAVSCISVSRCTAVGYYQTPGKVDRTLIEVWNGSTWVRVASPNVGTTENDLVGVSCVSATRCTAVGAFYTAAQVDRTLIEFWNGTTWTRLASPNVGTNHNVLFGVSCTSATECTAVGQYRNVANIHRSLIEAWSGASWTQVPAPNIGTGENELVSVSCIKGTTICKAVGLYRNTANIYRTLAGSSS